MEEVTQIPPTGLKEAEFDALLSELVGNGSPRASEKRETGEEWDKLTLLTGGFVPVGSIFWARPPKLHSQQRILLASREASQAGENADVVQGLIDQSNILCKLASELFYVREGTDFRRATEAEIGGDEVGLSPAEIQDAFDRLMGMDAAPAQGVAGNA